MSNLWKVLQSVIAGDPLRLGTIVTDPESIAGTVLLLMADGGNLRVRGTGTVGDTVFVQSGEVRSVVSGLSTFADQDV